MEIRYPFIIPIGIIIIISIIFIFKKKQKKYSNGAKIANTNYIKQNSYYKKLTKKYKLLINSLKVICLISLFLSVILISRIAIVKSEDIDEYNRDIFLCMDVSDSVNELNLEIVKNMKKTVNSLKGERFGISIFNSSNVILVPLTDDYDYVLNTLDKLETSINARVSSIYDDDFLDNTTYLMSGTIEGADLRGSSLIGDGLASCVYSFSNLEEERTRIIIFSTDNELAGTPLVTFKQAAEISKNKKIIVYGIGTEFMLDKNRSEFKSAVEETGGIFYEESTSSVNSIVSNIEKQSKSVLKKNNQIYRTDIPAIPFILLTISCIGLIILENKVIS